MKNEEVTREMEELLRKKEGLESNINRLKVPEGIEKELREKFQLKKPGEEFVVIVDEKSLEMDVPSAGQGGSLLEKTWNFIKSLW